MIAYLIFLVGFLLASNYEICPQVIVYGEDGNIYPTPCDAEKAGVKYSYSPQKAVVAERPIVQSAVVAERPIVQSQTPRPIPIYKLRQLKEINLLVPLENDVVKTITIVPSKFRLDKDSSVLMIRLNSKLVFANLSAGCYEVKETIVKSTCSPEVMQPLDIVSFANQLVLNEKAAMGITVSNFVKEIKEAYLTIKQKSSPR